jgi:hypothetical protein
MFANQSKWSILWKAACLTLALLSFIFGWVPSTSSAAEVRAVQTPRPFSYVSPMPGATHVSAGTTIVVREGSPIAPNSVSSGLFHVQGSLSGDHAGRVILAPDQKTVIFVPNQPFTPAEEISVTLEPGLTLVGGDRLAGMSFKFTVSPKPYPYTPVALDSMGEVLSSEIARAPLSQPSSPNGTKAGVSESTQAANTMPKYVTAPDLQFGVSITKAGPPLGTGNIFIAPWFLATNDSSLLILDDSANLVYYEPRNTRFNDFKRQPSGVLSYYGDFVHMFVVLNSSYQVVDTWHAGNGYPTDTHDLILLPNGHALLMIYDTRTMDLSAYGGQSNAQVIGTIYQELDEAKNVVFEWRGLDHFTITDTYQSLTTALVDFDHGNAIELDSDGNFLISSRHLSEITKINRQTGAIIWRLNGKNNQFTFANDTPHATLGIYFSYQHDIRRLPNGNITLFDNANQFTPTGQRYARGVEYALDEANKTATRVASYAEAVTPAINSGFMGNMQRLPNDNRVVGWGGSAGTARDFTEFTPAGAVALQGDITTESGTRAVSYRAFRFPWQGYPTWPPKLVAVTQPAPVTLYYSWNGATEIASYDVLGGKTPDALATPLSPQLKTGFEEHSDLTGVAGDQCFFQVRPIDNLGTAQLLSNRVYRGDETCVTGLSTDGTVAATKIFSSALNTGGVTSALTISANPVAANISESMSPLAAGAIFVWDKGRSAAPMPPAWAGVSFGVRAFDSTTFAENTTFLQPVEVTINYTPQSLFATGDTPTLMIWDQSTQAWVASTATLLLNDLAGQRVTFALTRGGEYALLAQGPTSVRLSGFRSTPQGLLSTLREFIEYARGQQR